MVEAASNILQVIALTLPAIALYMTVLTEIYQKVDEAAFPRPDPSSEAFQGPGPVEGKIEHKVNRGFVMFSVAQEQSDFRVAVLSFVSLVFGAMLLMMAVATATDLAYWIGLGFSLLGFGLLAAALVGTAYSAFTQIFPQ